MSIENHPNFHAVLFSSTIMSSYYEALRGEADKKNCPDITEDVIEFVTGIEAKVDAMAEGEPLPLQRNHSKDARTLAGMVMGLLDQVAMPDDWHDDCEKLAKEVLGS